jgi:hypothetical protein
MPAAGLLDRFGPVRIGGTGTAPVPPRRCSAGDRTTGPVGMNRKGERMDGLSLTTQRVAAAATGVSDVGASLAREIATMHDLLGQIRGGWQSSEAAPRFAAAMQGHLADATALKDALLGHGAALMTAAQRFGQTESALADAVPAVG